FPSANLNKNLIVPSLDSCLISTLSVFITKCSSSNVIHSLFTFFISEKCFTRFLYNQPQTCCARNRFSPCSTRKSVNCSRSEERRVGKERRNERTDWCYKK